MPSYTFVSTANAVVLRGAVPVFVRGPSALVARIQRAADPALGQSIQVFRDRDAALEWCEDRLLEPLQRSRTRSSPSVLSRLADLFRDQADRAAPAL